MLGKPAGRVDKPKERIKIMLLVAFGQKKMFKRIIPAFLHLLIYVGFVVINLEVLEFIVDGLTGHHRFFAPVFRWDAFPKAQRTPSENPLEVSTPC